MSKVGGTYPSVVFGVSEQVPQDRRPGQTTEQINMLSDPVHGLVRRRGSVWQDELNLGAASAGQAAVWQSEAQKMREFTFTIDGKEYSLLYRAHASTTGKPRFMFLFDKRNAQYIPITYENSTWVDTLIAGGASALACVGRYVYIAGNTTIPTVTSTDRWTEASNKQRLAAWIRAGAFSRKYTVTLVKNDGTTQAFSYTTKSAAYPTLLDTSDIAFYISPGVPDEEYQKKVNDRVNAYNGEVNAWIKTSAEDIQPENIATKLKDAMVAAGVTGVNALRGTVYVDNALYVDIRIDDGGDDTSAVAVGQEVTDPTRVTRQHYVGKVIRVKPSGGTDKESYYLEARSDTGATGWADVTWYEAAGVEHVVTNVVSQLIIEGGTAYVAQNGAGLEVLAPGSGPHPEYKKNGVGDGVTAPVPYYFGRPITMLSVFQDRLLVGADGTVSGSRNGDYLNFFRATVLAIKDNDPVEMYAYGSEGDTLRAGVMYDKDLVIFGDQKQYAINGRQVLSAKTPQVGAISAYEGATDALPVSSGNYVFYGKSAEGRTGMHSLRVSSVTESPTSDDVSQQLDQYIQGNPVQLCATTAPNLVLYRTDGPADTFYVYRYVDENGGASRLMDAWHKWQYAPTLGTIIGLSTWRGDALVYTMRYAGGNVYVVADLASTNAELDVNPCLDSMRPYVGLTGWHADAAGLSAAVSKPSQYFLLGAPLEDADEFLLQVPGVEPYLKVGAVSKGSVTPTNPFPRDQNGRAIMSGRMTLTKVIVSVKNSGGLYALVHTKDGDVPSLQFAGRILGESNNLISRQPVVTAKLPVSVGREVSNCEYTLETVDWQPLTITGIDWEGQSFIRVRRVS